MGPQLQTRSTYSLPSTSNRYAPCARSMNRGVPPTALNARTGELTPPGVTARARSNSAAEVVGGTGLTAPLCPPQRRDHEPPPAVTAVRSVTPQAGVTYFARSVRTLPARNPGAHRIVGMCGRGEYRVSVLTCRSRVGDR